MKRFPAEHNIRTCSDVGTVICGIRKCYFPHEEIDKLSSAMVKRGGVDSYLYCCPPSYLSISRMYFFFHILFKTETLNVLEHTYLYIS